LLLLFCVLTEDSSVFTDSGHPSPASILSISVLLAAMASVFTSSSIALLLVFAISFAVLTAVVVRAWLVRGRREERRMEDSDKYESKALMPARDKEEQGDVVKEEPVER
jgi:multisubunit Na+/H+ antiporter MnhG subunit